MAATGQRLYPSLPRVSTMLSASSGEEEEDDDYVQNEEERDPRDYYIEEDNSQGAENERNEERETSSSTNRRGIRHSAISLSEFEQDYFRGSPAKRSSLSGRLVLREQRGTASLRKHDMGLDCGCGQHWKVSLAVVCFVLGALCAVQQGDGGKRDNFLTCPQPKDLPCIKTADLPLALNVLEHVKKLLQRKSAELGCMTQSNVTVEGMKESLKEQSNVSLTALEMNRFIRLVMFNPHWGIRLMSGDGQTITEWNYGIASSDVLADVNSTKGVCCWVWLTLLSLWNYLQSVLIVLLLIVTVVVSVKWYIHRQHEELQSVFILVDKILEVLREHRKKCQQDKDLLPYVAIIHVRDMLIVPSERRRKHKLWEKAVQWVAAHESRVRVETRRIAGEDFTVWRWIQDDPPPTEEPQKLPTAVASNGESWQGKAFTHQSFSSPSPCVRLKNMFEPVKKMEEGQVKELMNAVLVRCCAHGGVVHVYVDKRSTFGCIYLKMESNKAATAAYNQLHGSWFKGRLVTAKYIPEPKYYKWFPHATNAKTLLSPSFSEEK